MKGNRFKDWKHNGYRGWMFSYLFIVFSFFALVEIAFILNRGRTIRMEGLQSNQLIYADIVDEFITKKQLQPDNMESLDSLRSFFPDSLHLSIIDEKGNVLYDNFIRDTASLENQRKKIEIRKALIKGTGWNIRESSATNSEYMFLAVHKNDYIIRTALPFTKETERFLKIDMISLSFILLLFVLVFSFNAGIYYFFRRFINKLKSFVLSFGDGSAIPDVISFPEGELRDIQIAIINIYDQLEMKKKDALLEREKLLQHFHFSEEGISFFTPSFENIYTNSHFIQYLNILLNEPTINVQILFQSPVFEEVVQFLKDSGKRNVYANKLHANGCHFFVRVIIFDDKSFEIIIRDISEAEKNHIDRAEMTNNIAHELRTPVTSVRGYLETLMERDNMSPEKKKEYIERAHNQIIRLSQIIQDVILLTKTNDAPQYFSTEAVNIYDMLKEMIDVDTQEDIQKHNCTVNLGVGENVVISGNRTLLYSIFFNLCTNALKYAGENVTITIHNYMEDDEYYYFSFSDNGKGIEDKYLEHIFERFYRIAEGRTRDKGGSGLGLSIVKDAVNFHNGVILAKNRSQGGLEFLFTLRKK
jgi:signal transduction histidine kinase